MKIMAMIRAISYQKYLYDNGLLIEYLWYGYDCSNYEYGCLLYDCEYPL